MRKFGDALKFAAEDQDDILPATFVKAVKQLNSTMAKEVNSHRAAGQTDEQACSPMPTEVYLKLTEVLRYYLLLL